MPPAPARGSLLVVFLTVFIDLLGFGMVLPLLPIYARRFDVDEHGILLGLLMSSFSLMQFLFAPVWGRLSDRVGRRPILMIGLGGSVVFYTVFGLATSLGSLTWMFVSRIGAGISGATIPTAQAYIADTTTLETRARGMALIGAAFGLGFTFGPLLAAAALFTSQAAGAPELSPWPGYVAAALSAVALLLAYFRLPESLTRHRPSPPARRGPLGLAALGQAMAIPTVAMLLFASFVSILAFANFEAILAVLLDASPEEGGFGYEFVDVVLFFALVGFTHAAGQGVVRKLALRTSEANLATSGALASIAGFLMLIAAVQQQSIGLFVAAVIVEAAGFAFMPAPLQSLISRRSDPAKQGAILGVSQSLGALGRIVGHAVCFPLFFLDATMPFIVGGCLMGLALLLITFNARRGGDFPQA